MKLRLLAGTAGAALALACPAPAAAVPVLDPADATELAQALAEATEVQDVCYGWRITLRDDSGGPSGDDVGSNFGPGIALDPARCSRWAVLSGAIHYTSEMSELEDEAAVEVSSNLKPPPTLEDLQQLGFGGGSLTGETNDLVLINLVSGLPLIVAGNGQAPYVEFETSSAPTAGQGEPTDTPGSDVLRQWWPLAVLSALAILAGLGLLGARLLARFAAPDREAARRPRPTDQGP